ncbi:MAG: hypothetical protein WB780_21035 [Candidatus Acidiferrales bacterium]
MFFLKFGLLTCAFYVGLTIVLEGGVWALIYFRGIMFFIDQKHPALSLAAVPAVIFGVTWLVSFSAAWFIVYRDMKGLLPLLPN